MERIYLKWIPQLFSRNVKLCVTNMTQHNKGSMGISTAGSQEKTVKEKNSAIVYLVFVES